MWPLYEPLASQTDPIWTAQLLWTYTVTAALSELAVEGSNQHEIGVASCWESLILSAQKPGLGQGFFLRPHLCISLFYGPLVFWHTGAIAPGATHP